MQGIAACSVGHEMQKPSPIDELESTGQARACMAMAVADRPTAFWPAHPPMLLDLFSLDGKKIFTRLRPDGAED